MNKFKSKALVVSIFAITSISAIAGQQTGQVTRVMARASDGLTYFFMSGAASGRPSCATNSYWMIKDENSAAGKRQIAMLIAARSTGQEITVEGAGTCSRWPDGEDVNFIGY